MDEAAHTATHLGRRARVVGVQGRSKAKPISELKAAELKAAELTAAELMCKQPACSGADATMHLPGA
jgi:hypothetical protein